MARIGRTLGGLARALEGRTPVPSEETLLADVLAGFRATPYPLCFRAGVERLSVALASDMGSREQAAFVRRFRRTYGVPKGTP